MKPFPSDTDTPITDALIAKAMAEYPTDHLPNSSIKRVMNRYFEAVHQDLAPLCRQFEAENRALRERLCYPKLKAGVEASA